MFFFFFKLNSNFYLFNLQIGIIQKLDSKNLFKNESEEFEFKEKLIDFIQKILLKYTPMLDNDDKNEVNELSLNDIINVDGLIGIDKKLIIVSCHILLKTFQKSKIPFDVSQLTNNNVNGDNDDDFNSNDNRNYTSTQINKQRTVLDLDKMIFFYLKVRIYIFFDC